MHTQKVDFNQIFQSANSGEIALANPFLKKTSI